MIQSENDMWKYLSPILLLALMAFNNPRERDLMAVDYVSKYYELAVAEMHRTGIPASITLAQGLHETNYGRSTLAREANNHFGIKCKRSWTGKTYYHKDDDYDDKGKLLDSCFRAYNDDIESYIDHSNFLSQSTNYVSLFTLGAKDYQRWAFGLKNCGYATDPQYAFKLIDIIQRYNLDQYDNYSNPLKG